MLIFGNLLCAAALLLLIINCHIFINGLRIKVANLEIFFLGLCVVAMSIGVSLYMMFMRFPEHHFLSKMGLFCAEAMLAVLFPLLTIYFLKYICGYKNFGIVFSLIQINFAVFFVIAIIKGLVYKYDIEWNMQYHIINSSYIIVYLLYNICSLIINAAMLFHTYLTTKYKRDKRIAGICVIFILAMLFVSFRFLNPKLYYIIPWTVILAYIMLYFYAFRISDHTINQGNASYYLYNAVDTPFLFISGENKVVLYNKYALSFFNISKYEIEGIDIFKLLRIESEHEISNRLKRYDATAIKTSVKCSIDMTQVFDRYNEPLCKILFINDITDKEALIDELKEAKEKAELSNQTKSIFLANTSHEIRTPMNAIIGMAELALMEEDISPALKEQLFSIKSAGGTLLSIINDILDISKIESGKMEIVPVNYLFPSLFHDIISIIKAKIIDKPILFTVYLDCKIPKELYGDEIRIRQIITNVLTNAVKYTNEGVVSLEVTYEELFDDTIVLNVSVKDTGIGIKKSELDQVFDDFVQIDLQRNRNIEGTGLGLAIAQRLCLNMGGSISVDSVYGQGSTFHIHIPQSVKDRKCFAEVINPSEFFILVYETRKACADSIAKTLTSLNLNYHNASNQSEFCEEYSKGIYTHAFVSYLIINVIRKIESNTNVDTKLVFMAESNELAGMSVKTITLPIHALSIANVLNKTTNNAGYHVSTEIHARFIAPEANVLIVDDIETNLKVASGLLKPYQMQIDCCMSGNEAIEYVKRKPYDIVFMDHMMPEMDGVEATLAIRSLDCDNGYYKNLPIVALTANAVSGAREMFLTNNLNDFLAKPIETVKLNQILETWIPKYKQKDYQSVLYTKEERDIEFDILIKGIDTHKGIANLSGSVKDYIDTLRIYMNDGYEKLSQLNKSYESRDFLLYTTYTHALKSASASIGADNLSKKAKALELAGQAKNLDIILEYHQEFIRDLELILRNLELFFQNSSGYEIDDDEDSKQMLKDTLKRLSKALHDMEVNEVDEAIGVLQSRKWNTKVKECICQIEQKVLTFDYDEAIELVDTQYKMIS